MCELNVTEGEWKFNAHDMSITDTSSVENEIAIVSTGGFSQTRYNNGYLLAQAKNMYEMIDSLSTELLHMIRKENSRLLQDISCTDLDSPDYLDEESVYLARKLMDACKPPKD